MVAFVATTAQTVQHRVDHGVEQAHAEARHESAEEIDSKAAKDTRQGLDADADKAHDDSDEGGLLVAFLLEQVTRRNAHHSVGDEVGEYAQGALPIRDLKLVLQDVAHGRGQVGDERNHTEQENHHNDRDEVVLFFNGCFH